MELGNAPAELAPMRQALQCGDADELAAAAHRLKGTIVYLGAAVAAARHVESIGYAGQGLRVSDQGSPACRLANGPAAVEELAGQLVLFTAGLAPHRPGV